MSSVKLRKLLFPFAAGHPVRAIGPIDATVNPHLKNEASHLTEFGFCFGVPAGRKTDTRIHISQTVERLLR